MLEKVKKYKNEWVIKVTGTVVERSSKNPNIPTGDIEVQPKEIEILSQAKQLPFEMTRAPNCPTPRFPAMKP